LELAVRIYHSTSRAAADDILRNGFLDGPDAMADPARAPGVWFAESPVDENEGATSSEVTLAIEIPVEFATAHEVLEYDYRTYCFRAEELRPFGVVELEDAEVRELASQRFTIPVRWMSSRDEIEWDDHLRRLARLATGDQQADVHLEHDWPAALDGVTIPSADFSGHLHPFITVRASQEPAELEATTLHEAAHWSLGHVQNEEHRLHVEADAAAGTDRHRASEEIAANRAALEILTTPREIVTALRSPLARVRDALDADLRRYELDDR
jgi:hypothetical protein